MRLGLVSGYATAQPPRTIALAIVQTWFVLGLIGVLCIPSLRGTSAWFGWLPFWFIAMPAAEWLLLRWRSVAVRSHGALGELRQRARLRRRPTSSRRLRKPLSRASRLGTRAVLGAPLLH